MAYVQKCNGEFYLVIRRKDYSTLSGRLCSKAPALTAKEVAIKLNVTVPETLFKTPQLQASVTIPEGAVTPPMLNAEVLDNVKEILEQQTGMAISLRMVEPQEKND